MSIELTRKISNLAYAIKTEGFAVIADVPPASGGESLGPGPHEYLETSLAACTAITLQMYAKRKNMLLESVDVKVKITKEGSDGNSIQRNIKLYGALNADQRRSLFEIAEKCPVHNFISRGAKIESQMVDGT